MKGAFERAEKIKDTIQKAVVEHSLPTLGTVKKGKIKKGAKVASSSRNRYSKKSKTVGDAGERTVLKFLEIEVPSVSEIRWLADEGETPGWDIQYLDGVGNLIRVEVKSTESETLSSIELTANEWRAANKHRSEYRLALVGSCLSNEPIIEFIDDPVGCLNRCELEVVPSRYEISW